MSTDRWMMDKENVWYISYMIDTHTYMQWKIKEGNSGICVNLDRSEVYYGKWNKPETEKQTL